MVQILSGVEHISCNDTEKELYIQGFAFIKGINIDKNYKIKKSIYIYNDEIKFIVPLKNEFRSDITDKHGLNEFNYDYSGFSGTVYLSSINYRKPLTNGRWKIGLYLNCDGDEIESDLKYAGNDSVFKSLPSISISIYNEKVIKKHVLGLEDKFLNLDVFDEEISYSSHIKNLIVNNPLVINLKSTLKIKKRVFGNLVLRNIYELLKHRKVVSNRVVFLSDSRTDFTGNFEFVYKELQSRGVYEIKYMLKESITAKKSLKEMITFINYIATSKYILLDDYYPQIYKYDIKDEIEVIQLWHATGAFKTFGFSRLGKDGGPSIKSRNHRNYTKVIVSSNNIRLHYAEAFGISQNRIIATGIPRTDIFFDEKYKDKIIKKFHDKYPIIKDKKVIMFAPTFRGSGQKSATYDLNKLDLNKLYNSLKDDYILILKLHPFIKETISIPNEYKNFVIDLSHEREINDLLFVTDILITDYSSVCFEYSLLNKPMIFFAYDLDDYIASRDFYYPYESFVPGPIAKTTDEIINIIKKDEFKGEKLELFRNRFFDHFDGKSTKRVVDMLLALDK